MGGQDLQDRVFVVTGANAGIGKETARELARRGGRVVLACRTLERAQPVMDQIRAETGHDRLGFVALDLADLASVRRAAQELLEREPVVHVLINNAGVAGGRGVTRDGFELAFGVNHLGHYLWTLLLLERLKQSAPARVVTVASRAHLRVPASGIDFDALKQPTRTVTGFPEYCVSKLCNVLFNQELARQLEGSKVTTYALHPGVIASELWREVPWPVRGLMKLFMKDNGEGARPSLHCATAPELAEHSGRYYDELRERPPSRLGRDPELAKKLWDKSVEWTRIA